MILKQLRLSRHLSQEDLAQMSGLNVRTIQRIESGHKASTESLKCLAAALEVNVTTLEQEKFVIDKHSDNWTRLPLWLKACFSLNVLVAQPARRTVSRILVTLHASGFMFCLLGVVSEPALIGGLILLFNAYVFHLLLWKGDKFGIWYDTAEIALP